MSCRLCTWLCAYPTVDAEAVSRAAELINNAKKPLALVGHGVELGNAQQELVDFIEKAGIPAARTMLGLRLFQPAIRLIWGC